MELYTPALVLMAIATVFALVSLAAGALVGPTRRNRAKVDTYECGIEPIPRDERIHRVPVKFYTVAMTFLIFDVELMFLLPWAVHFDAMGWFGFWAMMLFLAALCAAYAYEWRRGGLDWD